MSHFRPQNVAHGRPQRREVTGVAKNPGVAQHFRHCRVVERDDRCTAGHSLNKRDAEAFGLRGEDQHCGTAVQVSKKIIRHMADEENAIPQPGCAYALDHIDEGLTHTERASKDQLCCAECSLACEGSHEFRHRLAWVEPAYAENILTCEAKFLAETGPTGIRVCGTEARPRGKWGDRDPFGLHTQQLHHVARSGFGNRNNRGRATDRGLCEPPLQQRLPAQRREPDRVTQTHQVVDGHHEGPWRKRRREFGVEEMNQGGAHFPQPVREPDVLVHKAFPGKAARHGRPAGILNETKLQAFHRPKLGNQGAGIAPDSALGNVRLIAVPVVQPQPALTGEQLCLPFKP